MIHALVSIITPCYNGEKYLENYFQSILDQTYRPLELIFINDGSTDQTEEIALSYRTKLMDCGIAFEYLYQKNKGQAAALNRGLKLFRGDYLTWPDADDVMKPTCIERKVDYLERHPEIGMVVGNGVYYNPATGRKTEVMNCIYPNPVDIFENLLYVKNVPGHPSQYLIRKNLLLQCYPDLDIFESRAGQNWQILVPCSTKSLCGVINDDLFTITVHQDSHSRQFRTIKQEYQRWEDFTEILHHAIDYSDCDRDHYHKAVNVNMFRQEFYYAVKAGDRKKMKECLNGIKENDGKVLMKEKLIYIKHSLKRELK